MLRENHQTKLRSCGVGCDLAIACEEASSFSGFNGLWPSKPKGPLGQKDTKNQLKTDTRKLEVGQSFLCCQGSCYTLLGSSGC